MKFQVRSEIHPLQAVLVHGPGPEVDFMPPSMMDELLFDDLLYGPKARAEHLYFCNLLRMVGAKVFDFSELLSTALDTSEDAKLELLRSIVKFESLHASVERKLLDMPSSELCESLICGIRAPHGLHAPDEVFDLTPIPNLLFSRDAQIVMGDKIVFASMKQWARKRESILARFVFTHHPEFRNNAVLQDFSYSALRRSGETSTSVTIEGGDLLIFEEGIILAGISERTTEHGVDRLVDALRADQQFQTLIMVPMPSNRAQMHLDTIFTRVSEDECLVYAPMICGGSAETLSSIKINLTPNKKDYGTRFGCLLECLKSCGLDLKPIYCGGTQDYVLQAREQWTDGANSFALRPGMIVSYDRNPRTIEELNRNGFEVVGEKELGDHFTYDFRPEKKYVLTLNSTELTRARGGPRCMTMPLRRSSF